MRKKRRQETFRTLTKAEQKRKDRFERVKESLSAEGYRCCDLTIDLVQANVMAVVLALPAIVLLGIGFVLYNFHNIGMRFSAWGGLGFLLVFAALVVVHELVHGITWAFFTKEGWKAVSFGFIVKYLTPYCCCSETLKKGQYIWGALMPTLVLGILPGVLSIFIGSLWLFWLSAAMILAGGGDLTIVLKLVRFQADCGQTLYMDHPYEAGLVAFVKQKEMI